MSSTQIESARAGEITPEMEFVAKREDLSAELIRDELLEMENITQVDLSGVRPFEITVEMLDLHQPAFLIDRHDLEPLALVQVDVVHAGALQLLVGEVDAGEPARRMREP